MIVVANEHYVCILRPGLNGISHVGRPTCPLKAQNHVMVLSLLPRKLKTGASLSSASGTPSSQQVAS